MTRTPLRPLARILHARQRGENPDSIERENLRLRHEVMRDKSRGSAQVRLVILALCFFGAFTLIGARMGTIAASEPIEPRTASAGTEIDAGRADIVDRNGRILATNMLTHALYVQTRDLIDPARVARELAVIFPDLDEKALLRRFIDGRSFLWVRKVLSPEQMQMVHEIGDPGLLFGPREMRLYPNGTLAAHVLGGSSFGAEGVNSAEVIGTAGLERFADARLRDPAQAGTPLVTSLDITVQAAVEDVLGAGITMMNAKGGAAILMDVNTGEIVALAAGPTFDPNDRPANPTSGEPSDSPLFNRAVQGVYELGSTFKIFAAAQAIELGLLTPETLVDANAPMYFGKFKINEFEGHNYGPLLSVSDIIAKSSNVGTAHIAMMIGGERQQAFLKALGLFDASPVELVEAKGAKPLRPARWPEIVTITAAYGHGISGSPLNLATAYASIANGGIKVTPTLLKRTEPMQGERILSKRVALLAVGMMRRVVTEGTASLGDVPGYAVAGKTGTAEKTKRGGGYYDDKVINTFASVFPANDPKYVLVVTLDEPSENTGSKPRRTAGWTAVPVAAEIIRRAAPLLGMRPQVEAASLDGLVAVKN
ncbi:penicillin-binding protein 2 [Cypionkella sp.]|jgi:cell division protein FtsI (penicillin-binding protein 3)|uniref:peptidoglycan D,D-transpeptidase FtsI family protein n=1 Tax=Cypionkella sp. TaxID=2811411 RepID=UPI002718B4DF|nr:penicillin-binding protein 2 [Cypionkella sp.]MDO8985380.1 penicillin-binding protein 2 [Cypionkella sp.]MDP1578502.1 penicillin-binding protein 2 [Cypionkella sp.]MDP2051280.1 penicillin-binding protein 2 [Cypionkella sp.]